MATYTTYYNLKKPDTTDLVDIGDLNGNADKIDNALKNNATAIAGKQDALTAGMGITIDSDNVISATGGGSLPSGTADGDILVWDNTAQDWNAKQVRLPFAYQEVEYIESTGTQHIDTGFAPTDNFSLYMTLEMPPVSADSDFYIFGSTKASSPYRCYSIGGYNSLYHAEFGNSTNANFFSSAMFVGTAEISYNNGNISITDGTTTISQDLSAQSHSSSTVSMYIFATNNTGISGGQGHSSFKFKEATIYDGSALVRHFVPCYNKTTNDIGLFDLVNYKFYGNAGTGTFTKGADV